MVKKLEIRVNSPTYYAGSIVTGQLVVKVDKPKKYKLIKVVLIGKAEVYWETRDSDGKSSSHSNHEHFIDLSRIVWQKSDTHNGELPAGDYNFPFEISLPQNVPSVLSATIGKIYYKVYGKILTGSIKPNHSSRYVYLTINQPPLNVRNVTLPRPLQFEKQKDAKILFGASQPLKFSFILTRKVFTRGEAIPLAVSVSNQSSKLVMIVACIVQKEIYRARDITNTKSLKIVRVRSGPIESRCLKTWKIDLNIPLDCLSTYDNAYCKCITVEYTLNVKMKVPWSTNMKIQVPIRISDTYTHNVIQNPAPQSLPSPQPHDGTITIPSCTQQMAGQGIVYPGQQTAGTQPHQFRSPPGSGPVAVAAQQQPFMFSGAPSIQSQIGHPLIPQQQFPPQPPVPAIPSTATQQQQGLAPYPQNFVLPYHNYGLQIRAPSQEIQPPTHLTGNVLSGVPPPQMQGVPPLQMQGYEIQPPYHEPPAADTYTSPSAPPAHWITQHAPKGSEFQALSSSSGSGFEHMYTQEGIPTSLRLQFGAAQPLSTQSLQ